MRKLVIVIAATVVCLLGAAPAKAQFYVDTGWGYGDRGWWGGGYGYRSWWGGGYPRARGVYIVPRHRAYRSFAYYPRGYRYRSWWGGY